MSRVLALHLDKTLALPPEQNHTQSIERHLAYKKGLDYYCIITKTSTAQPQVAYSPLDNMDVLPTNSANRYLFLRDIYRMAGQVIEQHQIDAITVQDWRWLGLIGLLLRRRYGVALNVQLHNQVFDNPYYPRESREAWLGDKIARFVIPRSDTWWVGTRAQKLQLQQQGLLPDRIFHAPFSIEVERFYQPDGTCLRHKFEAEGRTGIVLWVGRMTKQKDIDTLIGSFRIVSQRRPDTILLLLGDGPEHKRLETLTQTLGLTRHVRFCGYVPYAQVPAYYAVADLVCMSSLYEGTCRTIHEGMAAAKPVVSTEVAGALDAIQDGITGYIVPRQSPNKLAEAMLHLLQDEALARQMGQAGRTYHAQHFTMERHCQTFIEMWQTTSQLTHKMRGKA